VLVVAFLAAVLLTGYLAFSVVRSAVSSLRPEVKSPEIAQGATNITPQDIANLINIDTPLQADDGPPPEYWDGLSRVNILFIGVDHREWMEGQGPPLADTLILATYDPQSQSVGMLSIPRDLWVELPGLGYHKINQSFQLGEATGYSGGGPAMAMDTVEAFLAVPIHFYVMVDFEAFVRLIDEVGGVKINVPEEIIVDPLGDNNTKVLQPGIQTLPGEIALAYARSRNTPGSDFDRAERQQQVIMGVRDRIASFEILPSLIAKAPSLYKDLSDEISTNLNVKQIFELAWDIQQIPQERIHRRVISHEQVVLSVSYDGMSILLPIPDEILLARDEIFSTESESSAPVEAEAASTADLVAAESASISVRNGTLVAGLAARTDYFLQSEGITALEITNADQLQNQTTIIDYTGKPNTTQYLAELLETNPGNVYYQYDPESLYDIVIILGEDWAEGNNMP
jgi:LCP family protein required for cell wall assembly